MWCFQFKKKMELDSSVQFYKKDSLSLSLSYDFSSLFSFFLSFFLSLSDSLFLSLSDPLSCSRFWMAIDLWWLGLLGGVWVSFVFCDGWCGVCPALSSFVRFEEPSPQSGQTLFLPRNPTVGFVPH